jgi:polar amino acid transport system substrate-binding protein
MMKIIQRTLIRLTTCGLAVLTGLSHAAGLMTPGQLKVGMEISYPPFESYDGDKIVGFDPELATLLATKIGVTPSYIDTKFTSLILGLASNKFDMVISGMYITPERLKKADAIPYARTGALIMVLKGSSVQPATEKDLCGLKVGLQQGTFWVKSLSQLSQSYCVKQGKSPITVQEFPTAPEVSQALMSRNVQAQLEIAGAAKMFVKRTKGRIMISSPDLVYPQTMGLYLKKGNPALKHSLMQAMAAIKADGSYQALIKKYDLTPVSP